MTAVEHAQALAWICRRQPVDPRPAVLFDTIWATLRAPRTPGAAATTRYQYHLMVELAAQVAERYGYTVSRPPGRPAYEHLVGTVRLARIPESWGCRHCGAGIDDHGTRFTPAAGSHLWVRPPDRLRLARMRALAADLELVGVS